MERILLLSLVATLTCVGCAASGTSPRTTRSLPPGKPAHCMAYATCNTGHCDTVHAQACPIECTGGTDGQPPACAPSMSCEMNKTAQYHACLGHCAAIPLECR